jgi:hypothetical protein
MPWFHYTGAKIKVVRINFTKSINSILSLHALIPRSATRGEILTNLFFWPARRKTQA